MPMFQSALKLDRRITTAPNSKVVNLTRALKQGEEDTAIAIGLRKDDSRISQINAQHREEPFLGGETLTMPANHGTANLTLLVSSY